MWESDPWGGVIGTGREIREVMGENNHNVLTTYI